MNIVNLKIIVLPANLFPGIITCSTLMSINEACRKKIPNLFFTSDQQTLL